MPRPLCSHWAQYRCNYGDACTFSHDGPGGSAAPEAAAGALVQSKVKAAAQRKAALDVGLSERELWELTEAAATSTEAAAVLDSLGLSAGHLAGDAAPVDAPVAQDGRPLCRHWQQYKCQHGDACRFSHDGPGGSAGDLNLAQVDLEGIVEREARREVIAAGDAALYAGPDPSKVCRHYLAGKCSYGASCSFSHGAPIEEAVAASRSEGSASPNVCKHFLAGRCNMENCRFSHDVGYAEPARAPSAFAPAAVTFSRAPTPQPYQPPRSYEAPVLRPETDANVCRHFLAGKCSVENCRFSHVVNEPVRKRPRSYVPPAMVAEQPATPSASSSSVCRHFLAGRCSVDTCRFSHVLETPAAELMYEPVNASLYGHSVADARICRHFLAGKCNVESCKFSHGLETPVEHMYEPVNEPLYGHSVADARICRHFLAGRCSVDNCKFSHGLETAAQPMYEQSAADSRICRHFLAGKCNVESCKFSHMLDVAPPAAAAAAFEPEVYRQMPAGDAGRPICRHYLAGKCNVDTCRFSHGVVDERLPFAVVDEPRHDVSQASVCRHFLAGKCDRNPCNFSHDAGGAGYRPPDIRRPAELGPYDGRGGLPARSQDVCRHFLAGKCSMENCRFSHDTSGYGYTKGKGSGRSAPYFT
eukprot:TRINITY_DN20497_c0_g1_i1.p1 TRINITY_DN20497_c0_g1~~TRINITY_DN20497_c0_g1_i1.p1  ORF type:complete len:643 (-),score=109.31 TRINITY_DN20497_c0_g1_i1:93-2021(-)